VATPDRTAAPLTAAGAAAAQSLLCRAAADAPTVHVAALGVTVRTLVATGESGGALAALDYSAPPGFRGPAPHWHEGVTETFIGVEGEPVVRSGGVEFTLAPGTVVVVPPRTVHAFANPGAAPARFLVLATPGAGFEEYFPALARLIEASPVWPPADPGAVALLASRYDTFPPPAP
jgi:mannose-6-phosphate isomerase-like protein (cupin superfamily)